MVIRGTGHRRKLTVPLWSGRRTGSAGRGMEPPGRGVVAPRREAGQASVETVALLPLFMLLALVMGQGAVAGYTAWSAAGAARIGARAEALGEDPKPAVRDELPRFLRAGARVRAADPDGERAGRITVRLRIPSIVPGVRFGTVRGRAQLPSQVEA